MFRDTFVASLALSAIMLPVASQAACPTNSTIFACTTTNGKFVEVCDAGKVIQYTFGRPGKTPELALSVPRDQTSTFQWAGIGRYMSYSVTIPNGNARYQVFFSVDRLSETQEIEAGINVEVDGEHVATVECKPNTVVNNMEGINLKPDAED